MPPWVNSIIDWLLDFGTPTVIVVKLLFALAIGCLAIWYWLKRIKKLDEEPEPSIKQSGDENTQAVSTGSGPALAAHGGQGTTQAVGPVTVINQNGVPHTDLPKLWEEMSAPIVAELKDTTAKLALSESEKKAALDELIKAREASKQMSLRFGLDEAEQRIGKGDTIGAEMIFIQALENDKVNDKEAFKEAAVAARHLGALAFFNDSKKSLQFYKMAVKLDPDNGEIWNRLGHLLRRFGMLEDAREAYKHALVLGNLYSDKKLIALATGNLGLIHLTQGELKVAEDHLLKAQELHQQLDSKEDMAAAYGNLGLIYRRLGLLEKAEEYHLTARLFEQELGRKEGLVASYCNLGEVFRIQGDFAKAEAHTVISLRYSQMLGYKEGVAACYGNLGIIYFSQGDFIKAEEQYRKSLSLSQELGYKEIEANQYGNLGSLDVARGNNAMACSHYMKAVDLFSQLGMKLEEEMVKQNLAALGCASAPDVPAVN